MSWECPHQDAADSTCRRLKAPCTPLTPGCVLHGHDLLGGVPHRQETHLRVHVLQHVPFEGLGSIADWLAGRKADVTFTRLFDPCHTLPETAAFDLLIALGGPMSVNDEARLPWLRDEKRLIARAIACDKAVLGICLGAQLIANALGARVFPNREKEIGWFPVYADTTGFAFPPNFLAFHWHGETFDLPPDAERLAHTPACLNQAFRIGKRVLGLQFHLETTTASAAALVEHCRDELTPAAHIQSEEGLLGQPPAVYAACNRLMAAVLDRLVPAAN